MCPGDFAEVLAAEAAEVARQEARVDAKAGQSVTLAGTWATLAVAMTTGLAVVAAQVSAWVLLTALGAGLVALLMVVA